MGVMDIRPGPAWINDLRRAVVEAERRVDAHEPSPSARCRHYSIVVVLSVSGMSEFAAMIDARVTHGLAFRSHPVTCSMSLQEPWMVCEVDLLGLARALVAEDVNPAGALGCRVTRAAHPAPASSTSP